MWCVVRFLEGALCPCLGTVSCPVRGPDLSRESGAAGSQGAWSGSILPSLSDFQQVTGVSGRTCVRKKSNTSIANLLRELRERSRKTLWKAALCERVGAAPWFLLALKLHPAFPPVDPWALTGQVPTVCIFCLSLCFYSRSQLTPERRRRQSIGLKTKSP